MSTENEKMELIPTETVEAIAEEAAGGEGGLSGVLVIGGTMVLGAIANEFIVKPVWRFAKGQLAKLRKPKHVKDDEVEVRTLPEDVGEEEDPDE